MRNAAEPCEKRIIFKKRKTKIGNETTCNERHIISNRLGSKSNSLAEIIRNALLWPTKVMRIITASELLQNIFPEYMIHLHEDVS